MSENGILSKKINELTVGDALKYNMAVIGVVLALPVVFVSVVTIGEKINNRLAKRKIQKELKTHNK